MGEGSSTQTSTSGSATSESSSTTGDLSAGSTTEEECTFKKEVCCLMDGEFPPHELLNAFIEAYPAANMPKSHPGVKAFQPEANGHAMAWSDLNAEFEYVDPDLGGVIEANILNGLAVSREAAEEAIPADATVLEVIETPVVIEDLGTPPPCHGVGWAWGSILFEAADTSIGELVYLYVGFCSAEDIEAFFYSDKAVEICEPIPQ